MKTKDRNIWHKVVTMLLCVVATCSFFSCSESDESAGIPDPVDKTYAADSRTVLVYIIGECSLERYIQSDINEMIAGIKNYNLKSGDNLVIYVDDYEYPRIYSLNNRTKATKFDELMPVKEYSEDVNSASAANLAEVIKWVKANYKSDSYGLVMWSHGSGWLYSQNADDDVTSSAPRRSIGYDSGENKNGLNGNEMNIDALANVLKNGNKMDFIFFDACFMQSIEVDYELKDCADFIIGSPAEIPDSGAYYNTMTPAMFKAENYAQEMVDVYKEHYGVATNAYGLIVSAVNSAKVNSVANEMKQYITKYRDALLSADYSRTQNYFYYGSWGTNYPDVYDMKGVMRNVLDESEYASFVNTMSELSYCKHADCWYSGYPMKKVSIDATQASGVSMFVPLNKYNYSKYKYNEMFERTQWYNAVWK